jgi:hypothetical protein
MATHRKQQGKDSQRSSKGQQRQDAQDLKQREYRDKDGNIHHHTRKWMEEHARSGESKE